MVAFTLPGHSHISLHSSARRLNLMDGAFTAEILRILPLTWCFLCVGASLTPDQSTHHLRSAGRDLGDQSGSQAHHTRLEFAPYVHSSDPTDRTIPCRRAFSVARKCPLTVSKHERAKCTDTQLLMNSRISCALLSPRGDFVVMSSRTIHFLSRALPSSRAVRPLCGYVGMICAKSGQGVDDNRKS